MISDLFFCIFKKTPLSNHVTNDIINNPANFLISIEKSYQYSYNIMNHDSIRKMFHRFIHSLFRM